MSSESGGTGNQDLPDTTSGPAESAGASGPDPAPRPAAEGGGGGPGPGPAGPAGGGDPAPRPGAPKLSKLKRMGGGFGAGARGAAVALGFLFVLLLPAGAVAVLIWFLTTLPTGDTNPASIAVVVPLLVVAGVGPLLALLVLLAWLLARQSPSLPNPNRAFGLPNGSVQAVVALILILAFVSVSIYLYASTTTDVAKKDMGQQLMTTVGTLAVAVAGFYFGAKSVETAAEAVRPT
jgi:hypothetical protein